MTVTTVKSTLFPAHTDDRQREESNEHGADAELDVFLVEHALAAMLGARERWEHGDGVIVLLSRRRIRQHRRQGFMD